MPIRIHIADDHAVFRSGLRAFLEKEDDFFVAGESGNTSETLEWICENDVDVLVLDINMPGPSSVEIVRKVSLKYPKIGILILTIHDEEHYLRDLVSAGARGFMVKTSTGQEVVQAIRTIIQGRDYIDPSMSKRMISKYLGDEPVSERDVALLTNREREVCSLLALGHTNTEVGETLTISKRTVEAHRAAIMTKIKLKSRAELVQFALDNDLLKR